MGGFSRAARIRISETAIIRMGRNWFMIFSFSMDPRCIYPWFFYLHSLIRW